MNSTSVYTEYKQKIFDAIRRSAVLFYVTLSATLSEINVNFYKGISVDAVL